MTEVSVVVAAYNQWRHLGVLLECLAMQGPSPAFEVLVCDDGSSPEMLAEVRRFPNLDIRYIWQPDRGFRLSRSRNNGVRCAQGRILIFVDADEAVGPDFIARHAAAHEPGANWIVAGTRRVVHVEGGPRSLRVAALWKEMAGWPISSHQRVAAATKDNCVPWISVVGGNLSVSAGSAIVFDEAFHGWGYEDNELVYRLIHEHGYRFRLVPELAVVHLFWNGESASGNPRLTEDTKGLNELLAQAWVFASRHPKLNADQAMPDLAYCEFDEQRGHWRRTGKRPRPVREVLAGYREWFEHQRSHMDRNADSTEAAKPLASNSAELPNDSRAADRNVESRAGSAARPAASST